MPEFIEIVKKRRSVRRYSPDPVPRDLIEKCRAASRPAPPAVGGGFTPAGGH